MADDAPRFSKRSQTVSLVLLVGAAGAAWALARIDPSQREEDALVYPNEEGCAAATVRSADECRDAFREARALYPTIAPRYATNTECETHHGPGGCLAGGTVSSEAAGWFIPVMSGVMLGRTLAQGLPIQPLFPHRPEERQGASGGSGGSYCTSSGGRVWASSGGSGSTARVSSAVARSRDTSARVVRGGLGGTGRSFTSSSSGHSSSHASSGG